MDRVFQIGNYCFQVRFHNECLIPDHFLQFQTKQGTPEFFYQIHMVKSLPKASGHCITNRPDIRVYQTDARESREIGIRGEREPYACYQELSDYDAEIWIKEQDKQLLLIDPVFTSLFALERHMIWRNTMILHCAYIVYQGKAILFSAPSETGKSTQAGLWKKYRGSHTVNGDRALLRKIDGRWTACGWPVCGSSEICELGDIPIHAIVILRQGKTNHVEQLSPFQAFTQLYAQVTINQWNRTFVTKTIELLEDIIMQISIWQLTCDMTEGAVECLESVLFPENQRDR